MKRIVVYHSGYGCDSGCCGHYVEELGEDGEKTYSGEFEFAHPYDEDPRAFAERLVEKAFGAERVKDLDWDACEIVND